MQLEGPDDERDESSIEWTHCDRTSVRQPDYDTAPANDTRIIRPRPQRELGQCQRDEGERRDMIELTGAHDEHEWTEGEEHGRRARRHVIVGTAKKAVQIRRRQPGKHRIHEPRYA